MTNHRTVTVEVTGDRTGTGPLTWGQWSILRTIQWLDEDDPYFNVPVTIPVGGGPSVGDVVAALGRLVGLHESLRTVLERRPDGWIQRVESGPLVVDVHEVVGEDGAMAVAKGLASRAFSLTDWPARWAVAHTGGSVHTVAAALSHTAIDNWSLRVLREDLASLLASGQPAAPPRRQPLDQAAYEREGAGAKRGRDALAYWERTLSRTPHSMFDYPAGTPEPKRFVRIGIDSQAMAVAAQAVATACQVSTSAVLLAATCAVLGAYTGHRTVMLKLIAGNRHDPALHATVAPAAQDAVLGMPTGEGTFNDAVRRGYLPAMDAYRNAHYDPDALDELRDRLRLRFGVDHDLSAFFNEVRLTDGWENLPTVYSPEQLKALTERTRIFPVGAWDKVDAKFFLATAQAPDTAVLHLLGDTAYLDRDTLERLLLAMETLLVDSVYGQVPMHHLATTLGLRPVSRPPGWVRTAAGWVDPSAVRQVVAAAAETHHAYVAAENGDQDGTVSLTAYLADADPQPALGDLHRAVVTRLSGRTDAVAPDRYVLCAAPPDDPSDPRQWREQRVVAAGDGR